MALIALVAICLAAGIWFCWESLTKGFYRDGFFNLRLLWGLLFWTGCGFAVMIWLQISN